jgi:hypothetical protein
VSVLDFLVSVPCKFFVLIGNQFWDCNNAHVIFGKDEGPLIKGMDIILQPAPGIKNENVLIINNEFL